MRWSAPLLRIRIDHSQPLEHQLLAAVSTIHSGGIVAFPTDTLYGLAVNPRSSAAVARIFAAKQRPQDQPIPLIAADLEQVDKTAVLTPLAARLASHFWPGPLSLIVPASLELTSDVHFGTGVVAVRVPDHVTARALARAVGHAITATSANLSGLMPASTPDEAAGALADRIDVLVDDGPAPGGLPSTIVDATRAEPTLVRAGAIAWDRVLEFLR